MIILPSPRVSVSDGDAGALVYIPNAVWVIEHSVRTVAMYEIGSGRTFFHPDNIWDYEAVLEYVRIILSNPNHDQNVKNISDMGAKKFSLFVDNLPKSFWDKIMDYINLESPSQKVMVDIRRDILGEKIKNKPIRSEEIMIALGTLNLTHMLTCHLSQTLCAIRLASKNTPAAQNNKLTEAERIRYVRAINERNKKLLFANGGAQ